MLDMLQAPPFKLPILKTANETLPEDLFEKLQKIFRESYAYLQNGFPLLPCEAEYKIQFQYRRDVLNFLENPANAELEPEKFRFCTEYERFEAERKRLYEDPELEDAKNFAYLLDSIEGDEMKIKTFNKLYVKEAQQDEKEDDDKEVEEVDEEVEGGVIPSSHESDESHEEESDAYLNPEQNNLLGVMPDNILINMFSSLDVSSLAAVQASCKQLSKVAKDQEVWRNLLARRFNISESVLKKRPDNGSWEQVYKALHQLNQQEDRRRCCRNRKRIEAHWFVFFIPNVMISPNPAAYQSLSKLLKRAREITMPRHEQYKNNELVIDDFEMLRSKAFSEIVQYDLRPNPYQTLFQ